MPLGSGNSEMQRSLTPRKACFLEAPVARHAIDLYATSQRGC